MPPHLLVVITPHGLGHATLAATVVNALGRRLPELRLTVQSSLPRAKLEQRFTMPFDHVEETPDFGMIQSEATAVRVEETAAAYAALHVDFAAVVAAEGERMARLGVDAVFTSISYVALAAAQARGIPAIGLSPLNWADLYRHYCGDRPEAGRIVDEMLTAYHQARVILRPEPSMPMDALENTRLIGPVARRGRDRRGELAARLGLSPEHRVGLIAFGGYEVSLPYQDWPRHPAWHWIVPVPVAHGRGDMTVWSILDMPFIDLMRSVDLALTKPGYGMFSEAGVNGTPVLYVARPDWPEAPYLVEWLESRGRCLEMSFEGLAEGALWGQLQTLFSFPDRPLVEPTGVEEAVGTLLARLGQRPS